MTDSKIDRHAIKGDHDVVIAKLRWLRALPELPDRYTGLLAGFIWNPQDFDDDPYVAQLRMMGTDGCLLELAYRRLIEAQYRQNWVNLGALPDDDDELLLLAKLPLDFPWEKVRQLVIKRKFVAVDGHLIQIGMAKTIIAQVASRVQVGIRAAGDKAMMRAIVKTLTRNATPPAPGDPPDCIESAPISESRDAINSAPGPINNERRPNNEGVGRISARDSDHFCSGGPDNRGPRRNNGPPDASNGHEQLLKTPLDAGAGNNGQNSAILGEVKRRESKGKEDMSSSEEEDCPSRQEVAFWMPVKRGAGGATDLREAPDPDAYESPVLEAPVFASRVRYWEESFPGLDVKQQLRSAQDWLRNTPAKRKTAKGLSRFLGSWLTRANDSGRTFQSRQPRRPSLVQPRTGDKR